MTDVNVAIVSPTRLLKATSAMCFPRIQVAFRWSSPMAPPIVRLMGEPGLPCSDADAFCYQKKGEGRASWAFGGKVSSCGRVGFQK